MSPWVHFNLFRKRSRKCRRKKSRLGEGFDGQVAVVPISWDTNDETFGFPEGCSEHRVSSFARGPSPY